MADTPQQQQSPSGSTGGLDDILTTLQQGVQAINNLTKTMSVIFPSS